MPLWSNEDWRARIGSCWCALGRTYNTRFTRCRGKSRRYLSTHQAATMVIMMILFIAANMGLYVTRERHKNLICISLFGETIMELYLFRFGLLLTLFVPVLKFVVQMVGVHLPSKLKMSLKQFFVDLNDSLCFIGSVIRTFIVSPVLFVVNFTMGNIYNVLGKLSHYLTKMIGDRLSNGILLRSLVVVIVVTIQLLVSVMDARVIIFFLLLISGDVERNPGPDYSVTKELLVELETTAVQSSLLLRCGDVESNPGPLSREGGMNQDVGKDIDELVKSGHITNSDRMFNDLALVISETYEQIGIELGLEYRTLCDELGTGMFAMKKGSEKAMKMLQLWRQSIDEDHFTYSVLAAALEKHGHQRAAHKFCYTDATSNLRVQTHGAPTVNSGNIPSLAVASVSPTVNMPHGYHNLQSLHPSSSFMLPPPAHMHNLPSFLHQLNNQGFESVPPPKRYKPDPPMGQVALSTSTLQGIDRWCQKLINFYLAQEHVHAVDEWPPLKAVDFFTLALVKQNKQASHINLQTIQENVEAVYGQKINVCLNDLFKNIGNRALVLFEGRPGSGKTSLMVKISCDWGRKKILKSKLVLLVRLRHLSKTGDIYLHDLLQVVCPAFTPDDVQGLSSFIEGRLGEDVVFLLDGFDEYAPGASDENYISKLILKMEYSQSIVMLSSRPAAAQRFRHRTTLWVEVVGFMKTQVLQYIKCYFEDNEEKSSSLIQHLKEHHNLMNLCYLPLHCAMLVFLYKNDATLPETETEFYRDFTFSLLIRDHVKDTKRVLKLKSFDCLSDKKKEALTRVCKLAFEATIARRQVFEESEVQGICFKDNSENTSESLGLVVMDRYFSKSGVDETYTFLHLTLQEYLAALFVSELSESEQISTIATHFPHQHLFVTSRFLFGILDYSKENTKKLFEQMLGATKNHLLHHIRCACESHSASACNDVVNFHDRNLSFHSINNSSDIFYITYVLKTIENDAIELFFSECYFDISDAVSLLQGVGDRQLSLTIKQGEAAKSMLNALSRVTVPGLVELLVAYENMFSVRDKLTMGPNNLKYSTNLQKLDLQGIDISNSGLEKAFKFWPNLVKLNLYHCCCRVTSVAEVLGEGLQHMTKATDQTLEITIEDCYFNKEATLGLLQAVGDRRLSLIIRDYNWHGHRDTAVAQSLVDALCLVTLPGLIELDVTYYVGDDDVEDDDVEDDDIYLTIRPSNLKHSTYLQKLELCQLNISNSGLEKALKHLPNLVELNLYHCRCRVTSVAEVLEEDLQHMTKAHHTIDQTLEISLKHCYFNKEAALGLLQAVGDRRLSLTIKDWHTDAAVAQPLVDALCLVTLPGLIELNVTYEGDDVLYLTMRPNNLKHSTYLQKLELRQLDVSNSGLEKALKHLPNLVELKLCRCHCPVTPVAEVLEEGLQHMTKAHHTTDQTLEIELFNCYFDKEVTLGLLQAVGDRCLSLTISHEGIHRDIDVAQLLMDALCLVTLLGLIELNVTYDDDDVLYLTMRPNNLKHSTYLQKLGLCRLDVSNSGLEKALEHWPNLAKLGFAECNIDASTAVVLGESLKHTSKLQTLIFHSNPIGDDGLHALSLPIKNYCKELKELWFLQTQLTDRSITCLTEWIKVLNNLEELNLRYNHFSEGGVKQIEEAVSERNTREGVAKLKLDISDQEPLL